MSVPEREKWVQVVSRIRAGDPSGQEALYRAFSPGLRLLLLHYLHRPEEADDRLHNVFVAAVSAIREGQLREPERLAGFLRTIARRQIAAFLRETRGARGTATQEGPAPESEISPEPGPEELAIAREQRERAVRALASLSPLDREVLTRFYWLEQEPLEICQDLGLTYNQFRLRKSRAKARFAEAVRQEMQKNPAREVLVRKTPASGH